MRAEPGGVGAWLAALAELVWPLYCAGCARPGIGWCEECAQLLDGGTHPASPVPRPAGLPPAYAAADYDGPVRRAVLAWKDAGRHDLSPVFGAALSRAVDGVLASTVADGPVLVVPMPSRSSARRARGADVVRELAVRAAAGSGAGADLRVAAVLTHTRRVQDQAGLDAADRAANLSGALTVRPRLRPDVRGRDVLLVDDVMTTGATLAAAAAAVRAAGAHPFGVAVVAATVRTFGGNARPSTGPPDAGRS